MGPCRADNEQTVGSISVTEPERINEFEASGSLVIDGVELHERGENESETEDSGYSMMRVIDDGDIVDCAEIGDIIEGSNGQFSLIGVPRDTPLALEISYAPVINLRTGAPFSIPSTKRATAAWRWLTKW